MQGKLAQFVVSFGPDPTCSQPLIFALQNFAMGDFADWSWVVWTLCVCVCVCVCVCPPGRVSLLSAALRRQALDPPGDGARLSPEIVSVPGPVAPALRALNQRCGEGQVPTAGGASPRQREGPCLRRGRVPPPPPLGGPGKGGVPAFAGGGFPRRRRRVLRLALREGSHLPRKGPFVHRVIVQGEGAGCTGTRSPLLLEVSLLSWRGSPLPVGWFVRESPRGRTLPLFISFVVGFVRLRYAQGRRTH